MVLVFILQSVDLFLSKTSAMLHIWHVADIYTIKEEHMIYTDSHELFIWSRSTLIICYV